MGLLSDESRQGRCLAATDRDSNLAAVLSTTPIWLRVSDETDRYQGSCQSKHRLILIDSDGQASANDI